jgi:hypothetical protein
MDIHKDARVHSVTVGIASSIMPDAREGRANENSTAVPPGWMGHFWANTQIFPLDKTERTF